MATNRYFNNFNYKPTQNVFENIVIEYIQRYGLDVYYCPSSSTANSIDPIFGESLTQTSFDSSYTVEMFVLNVDGFQGEQNVLAMAGLEIKDRIRFAVSKKRFEDEITIKNPIIARPREGDLVYFPLYGAAFQIKYVENRPYFYQFGDLPTYELTCELWNYSGETLNTGIPDIDGLAAVSTNILDHGLLTNEYINIIASSGELLLDSSYLSDNFNPLDDSIQIQKESDVILDWDNIDPFSEGDV